jgi:hypothetical protein
MVLSLRQSPDGVVRGLRRGRAATTVEHTIARLTGVVILGLVLLAPAAHGQGPCESGEDAQGPAPGIAFVALAPLLGEAIGEPVDCEHTASNGDPLTVSTTVEFGSIFC